MSVPAFTLDTTFKRFVKEARDLGLAHIKRGTGSLAKTGERVQPVYADFIDIEEGETHRQAGTLLRHARAGLNPQS